MTPVDLLAHVAISFALGTMIGIERQWRSGLAGIRTNALVAGGSALFVVLGDITAAGNQYADPTRIAAQVVSGVGFLGAGVIMREGPNVRGLTTAATLWCSAAIGTLTGFGLYLLAGFGTAAIIFINTSLRPLSHAVNRRRAADISDELHCSRYVVEARTTPQNEQLIRSLLLEDSPEGDVTILGLESTRENDSEILVRAELSISDDSATKTLLGRLQVIGMEPNVSSVRWWSVTNSY